jgi:hypothetical protein
MAKTKPSGTRALPVADSPARPVAAGPVRTPSTVVATSPPHHDLGDQVSAVINGSVRTVRSVLPASRLPLYLVGAALLITGLADAPVVLGTGLAFEALRRWAPASPAR